jgi:hypothetical protein
MSLPDHRSDVHVNGVRCGVGRCEYDTDPGDAVPYAFLPHSCNEWVIGGIEEIEKMILQLKAAADMIKTRARLGG